VGRQWEKIMNSQKHTAFRWFAAIAWIGVFFAHGVAVAQQDEVEIMTRGPVHEAFAGTVSYNPEPGIIVTAEVPATIEEVPPEQRPEGDNVAWIPGYWAWDDEQNGFLWISGIWRNLPPGRQWVPGYWAEVQGGYQWTSGYWEDAETTQVTYLPEPPRSLEVGPNISAPSDDYTWIPGNWTWTNSRYAWSAGYWSPVRTNWIWVPGCYRWTNCGYIYVGGYWDYAVASRGVLFAPVHFRGNACYRPGYFYSPSVVISLGVFSNHLFLRPNYCHYYFGDYYAPSYRNRGFYASYAYNSSRYGYDPIYSHYRWENRKIPHWERGRRDYYENRRDHENARPPRTFAALNSLPENQRRRGTDYAVAEPLSRYAKSAGDGRNRFQTVNQQDRERIAAQTRDVRKFSTNRRQLETRRQSATAATGPTRVVRDKVGRSPLVSKVNERSDKSVAPPQRLERRSPQQSQETANTARSSSIPRPGRETQAIPQTSKGRITGPETAARTDRRIAPQTEKRVQPGPTRKEAPSSVVRKPEPSTQAIPRPSSQTSPNISRQQTSKPSRAVVPSPTRQSVPAPRTAPSTRVPSPAPKVQPQRTIPQPSRKAVPSPAPRPQIQRVQPQRAPQTQRIQPQRTPQPQQIQRIQPQRTPRPQPQQIQRVQPQRSTQSVAPQRSSSRSSVRPAAPSSEDWSRGGSRR
jgi:hypothetical protein